ncbi:hypothetical protein BKA81DRAFT_218775 [Phyllosticta paracitricarpa]
MSSTALCQSLSADVSHADPNNQTDSTRAARKQSPSSGQVRLSALRRRRPQSCFRIRNLDIPNWRRGSRRRTKRDARSGPCRSVVAQTNGRAQPI